MTVPRNVHTLGSLTSLRMAIAATVRAQNSMKVRNSMVGDALANVRPSRCTNDRDEDLLNLLLDIGVS